jgi:hypothetical protein
MIAQSHFQDPDKYHEALMRQYLQFCQATQDIMARREQANRFFITVTAGLLAGVSWIFKEGLTAFKFILPWVALALCFTGLGLCLVWMIKLAMYRRLSSARFQVIQDMEACLPYPVYRKEWGYLQDPSLISHDPRHPNRRYPYLGLTFIERLVPLLLCIPYVVLAAGIIYYLFAPPLPPFWAALRPA